MLADEHPEWPGTEPRTDLTYLGYWRSMDRRHKTTKWPDPLDFVDPSWDPDERLMVIEYLKTRGKVLYEWLGTATCRFCGIRPCGEPTCFEDGTYGWPSGLAHYLEKHDLRVPQVFVDHVYSQTVNDEAR